MSEYKALRDQVIKELTTIAEAMGNMLNFLAEKAASKQQVAGQEKKLNEDKVSVAAAGKETITTAANTIKDVDTLQPTKQVSSAPEKVVSQQNNKIG